MSNKKLVAYFSTSGTTKKIAEIIAKENYTDIFEINPKIPYTNEDLDWTKSNSRSTVEMNDMSFRPEIVERINNIEEYSTIYLGFPIWWYKAPSIINTFLESYDLSNKTIILFATSGGSGFGKTINNLTGSCSNSTIIKEGKVFSGQTSSSMVISWVNSIK